VLGYISNKNADANRFNKSGFTEFFGFAFVCVWISFCFRYMAAAESACGWSLESPLLLSIAAVASILSGIAVIYQA